MNIKNITLLLSLCITHVQLHSMEQENKPVLTNEIKNRKTLSQKKKDFHNLELLKKQLDNNPCSTLKEKARYAHYSLIYLQGREEFLNEDLYGEEIPF